MFTDTMTDFCSKLKDDNKDLLIKQMNEYINFLSDEINRVSPFLFTHNQLPPEKIVLMGIKLRENIENTIKNIDYGE